MVNVPETGPPPDTVKPGSDARLMVNGDVMQLSPTGRLTPNTVRLVICRVTVAVLVIPVAVTVPVAGATWLITVVADTGMKPSTVVEAVAGGMVRVADDVPVLRSTVADSVPDPRSRVVFSLAMVAVPVSG